MSDDRMRGRGLTTPLDFDLQDVYDQARALSAAWTSFAITLANEAASVCTHPEGARDVVVAGGNAIHTCMECERIVRSVPLIEEGGGE